MFDRGPPLFSIAILSGAALAYEILLMRLFSIIQWHHFAYMMISLALLGYGASGTMLALAQRWVQKHFFAFFITNAILFGIGAIVCFRLAQAVPFNALEVLWDTRQPLWLLLIFMLLFMPFFSGLRSVHLAAVDILVVWATIVWMTVASPSVPFRHAPGLSLNSPGSIPEQLAIFTDADSVNMITRYEGSLHKMAYLDFQTSALPYHLLDHPEVMVLGAGGGADVLQALYHRSNRIDAVEINPQVVDLVQERFADFAGDLYLQPRVSVFKSEARGFVTASRDHYDLIQVALLDSFSASSAGLYALSENYLYTVEAFSQFLHHLLPEGVLSITRWTKTPPRDGLKTFATAIAALEASGVTDPEQHMAMIRSWNTSTLLLKRGAFDDHAIDKLKSFCRLRSFDLVYYPGITRQEANRYNQLQEPWFFDGAQQLLGPQSAAFMDDYKFNIHPATDDRPYFSHFLKWRTLPELLELSQRGGMPLLEWGYLVLIVTLAVALVVSFLLVLLPLIPGRSNGLWSGGQNWRIIIYFAAIGTAFMFIEIAFIQKFLLFLHHPLYAASVVLCAFLVFAGMGSKASSRWRKQTTIRGAGLVIGGLSLLYLFLLPLIFDSLVTIPVVFKIPIAVVLIAPLAFLMGAPFPLGLDVVSKKLPVFIPWAWAINGCASVAGAILATLLAIHFGFLIVVTTAAVLYALAALALPR